MTLTHISFDIVRRLESSALKTAAYLACGIMRDGERTYDFSRKANELIETAVLLPQGSPSLYLDPEHLWSAAEKLERQANGQSARQVLVSIPRELPEELWPQFAREIAKPWVTDGMACYYAIHCPLALDGEEQPHVHFQLSMRRMSDAGFATIKAREWNHQFREDKGRVERQRICDRANEFFARHSLDIKIDPRSLSEQGIDRPPEPDAPRSAWQQWKREGGNPEQTPEPVKRVLRHREARQRWRQAAFEVAKAGAEIKALEIEIRSARAELEEKDGAQIASLVNQIGGENQMARRPRPGRNGRQDSWTRGTSGIDGLSDRQRAEAESAYKRWRDRAAGAMADPRYTVADYVAYVQDHQRKRDRTQDEDAEDLRTETSQIVAVPATDSIAPMSEDAAERSRRAHLEVLLAERYKTPAELMSLVKHVDTDIDGRRAILHTDHGKIVDYGDKLEHSGEMSAELARVVVMTAAAKGWSSIKLNGGPDFKEALAIAAACHRPPIQTDHELDRRGRESVRKLMLKEAAASVQPAGISTGGSPAEMAAARIRHEIDRCVKLLATEPQGSRSSRDIAAPKLTELAERRERKKEDAQEAIRAAAAHREAHGWAVRLLDPAARRRQASLDAEAAALDAEARRLDRRHEKSVTQIERSAEKEAKANTVAHEDWKWSREIRTQQERLGHLKSIETALSRGDEATIAAAASGDLRAAYVAAQANEEAHQRAIRDAWSPEERRKIAIDAAVAHERSLGKDATVMDRANAGSLTAAVCAGDDAAIRAASEGRIQDAMKAAIAWEQKEKERRERIREEMEQKEALERRSGADVILG